MDKIINLSLTSLLALYVFFWQKRYGKVRMWIMGTGFFVVAFYLDNIFWLIMGSITENEVQLLFQGLGIMVSKGIMAVALAVARIMEHGPKEWESLRGDWQYLDGLTLCINLFFLLLGVGVMFAGLKYGSFAAALLLMLFLGILVVYYSSLWIYRKKQAQKRAQSEAKARKHEADIYLESVEDNYQRMRELWHDLRNHISLLSLLLADKKYEQMADYLRIFSNDVDTLTLPMKSGNLVVDAMLTDKLAKARKEDIEVTLSLCDLTDLNLRPDEICGLLGNLLDNALEANRQVAKDRFLTVDCRNREDFYYIKITNAAQKTRSQNGIWHTVKSDRKNQVGHGLGLRSVERIVHSCGGELAVDSSENQFTAVVRLPK